MYSRNQRHTYNTIKVVIASAILIVTVFIYLSFLMYIATCKYEPNKIVYMLWRRRFQKNYFLFSELLIACKYTDKTQL